MLRKKRPYDGFEEMDLKMSLERLRIGRATVVYRINTRRVRLASRRVTDV